MFMTWINKHSSVLELKDLKQVVRLQVLPEACFEMIYSTYQLLVEVVDISLGNIYLCVRVCAFTVVVLFG